MMNKNIEQIRMENDKLYNKFLTECEELQPKLRHHSNEMKELIDSTTIDKYNDLIQSIKNESECQDKEINSYEEFSVLIFNRQTRDIYQRFKQLSDEYKKEYFDLMKKDFLERFEELKLLKVFNNAYVNVYV